MPSTVRPPLLPPPVRSFPPTPLAPPQLFLKRSLSKSTQIVLQLLIDGASGAGAYYAARSITPEQLGTWSLSAKCEDGGEAGARRAAAGQRLGRLLM